MNKDKEKEREVKKAYYEANKEKILAKRKLYRETNKELLKEKRKANLENINKQRQIYVKQRKKDDPIFKLKISVRKSIHYSLKRSGFQKLTKTELILGCSYDEFKNYIQSKFEDWMTWENKGLYNGELNHGWDIDHIIPVSTAKNETELLQLNHYSNLQPLCSHINRDIKRDNI